jgi:Xaa-Pro aminopeptidase
MFDREIYMKRRQGLHKQLDKGLVVLPGNGESAMNYKDNPYRFRQDSNFLYFFGIDHAGFVGIMDLDSGTDHIFGDDIDVDDIIWMGEQPTVKDHAEEVGVGNTGSLEQLGKFLREALKKGRQLHFLPFYRGDTILFMSEVTGLTPGELGGLVSEPLIRAVVNLRSYKGEEEIREIEFAMDIAWEMHTTVMKMARPGILEREVAGTIEGIAAARGNGIAFPIILTINGQTLHNHYHGNEMKEGRLVVTDAGAESLLHYASDITRTVPVSGHFDQRQKDIYEIVLKANTETISAARPGITNKNLHLMASRIIANGLKEVGLMRGDMDQAVSLGAVALFFPHGLGHMMGLDVHDMEGLGEDYVGYNEEMHRSEQFGMAYLRLAKKLEPGFVFTIEPGIYFIPALIEKWRSEKKFTDFINYDKLDAYMDFGGIRIEDDVYVRKEDAVVLGRPIPKTVEEIETIMRG